MSETTGISWTDSTWSPIQAVRRDTGKRGCACVKISPGCKNCYSETFQLRNLPSHGTGLEFTVLNLEKVDIVINEEILLQPLKWKKPRMIFVCSQTDLFGEFVSDEQIDRVFAVMALCPQHTFQVLTKRAERMLAYFNGAPWGQIELSAEEIVDSMRTAPVVSVADMLSIDRIPLPHVWLGISAENQEWADKRIPLLLRTPAAVRFISAEPLLGPINFSAYMKGIHSEIEAKRAIRLSVGLERGSGDNAGRDDMESSKARMGQMEEDSRQSSMQESSGGARLRSILSGSDSHERREGLCTGPPIGLPAFQGTNTADCDSESRRRKEEEQSSRQSGVSDAFRANEARVQDWADGRARGEEPWLENKEPHSRRDQIDLRDQRSYTGPNSSVPGGQTPDYLQDRSRGVEDEARRPDSGLCRPATTERCDKKSAGAIFQVIVGGESGRGARQCRVEWIESIIDQCRDFGAACFVKQLGAYPVWAGAKCTPIEPARGKCDNPMEWPESLRVQQFPATEAPR